MDIETFCFRRQHRSHACDINSAIENCFRMVGALCTRWVRGWSDYICGVPFSRPGRASVRFGAQFGHLDKDKEQTPLKLIA